MDAIIIPQMEVNTEEDLTRFLEFANLEMRHSAARMDELDRRIEQTQARIDERGRQIDQILGHVQAS